MWLGVLLLCNFEGCCIAQLREWLRTVQNTFNCFCSSTRSKVVPFYGGVSGRLRRHENTAVCELRPCGACGEEQQELLTESGEIQELRHVLHLWCAKQACGVTSGLTQESGQS